MKTAYRKKAGNKSPPMAGGKKRKKRKSAKKLSRLRKPEHMPLETWQVELRRQFGREQKFSLKNLGSHPLFSEFEVANPQTNRTYRVAIRGAALGENYCSCPDYAVNTLGTCKHIEFAIDRLGRRPAAKAALALGHQPEYSETYLHYGCPPRSCVSSRNGLSRRPASGLPAELFRRA